MFNMSNILFLVACTRLYRPLCPSVGWYVGWLVSRLVGWLVGQLVGRSHFTFFMILFLWRKIENKWCGVAILLRTGGQGLLTPIYTSTPPNMNKKYLKCSFSCFQLNQYGPMGRWTNRQTDKASFWVACPQLKRGGGGRGFTAIQLRTVGQEK